MTWHVSAFAERPSAEPPGASQCTVILPTLRMGARWPSVIVVRNRQVEVLLLGHWPMRLHQR